MPRKAGQERHLQPLIDDLHALGLRTAKPKFLPSEFSMLGCTTEIVRLHACRYLLHLFTLLLLLRTTLSHSIYLSLYTYIYSYSELW